MTDARPTALKARRLLTAYLTEHRIPFSGMTARTVSFTDLARDSMVFITLAANITPEAWIGITHFAGTHGFRVVPR
jgi:hypothetical protein